MTLMCFDVKHTQHLAIRFVHIWRLAAAISTDMHSGCKIQYVIKGSGAEMIILQYALMKVKSQRNEEFLINVKAVV